MNKFSKVIVVFSTFLVLSFFFLFITITGKVNLSNFKNGVNSLVSPFQNVMSIPTRFFSEQKQVVTDLLSTYEDNVELRQSIQLLEAQSVENSTLKAENASLRSSLGLSSSFSEKQYTPASVLERYPSAWSMKLSINIGENSGISMDDFVISNGGLIGVVSSVSSNSSEVTLLTNANDFKKIPVKFTSDSGGVYGILSSFDSDSNSFVVNQLSSSDEISVGSEVVSSDLAGASPANVLIGVVKSVKDSSNKLNREVYIEPSANFSNIYSVLVVGKANE